MGILQQLKRHEGFRAHPYSDMVGAETIGYGRNLRDKGISEAEAKFMLLNDIRDASNALRAKLPWYDTLNPARQNVLVNMTVNMGIGGVLKFQKMLAAAQESDFDRAAREMLNSKWATQVGARAIELANQMKDGV